MVLSLENAAVSLAERVLVKSLTLEVGDGEIVTLMGPSGVGKSSLLSFVAGDLDPPFRASGRVMLDGRRLTGLPPEQRGIGRLFQDDLLFPHLTVGENLLFGMPRGGRDGRLAAMRAALADADLAGFENRAPQTLSGGQRSRIALMRALLAEPRAMLLDEPFNKLDRTLRGAMREFVFGHLGRRGISCLMVTHDRDDAPAGGRILELRSGGEVADA
jgi:putative thiamine transport system ATP-binding protein